MTTKAIVTRRRTSRDNVLDTEAIGPGLTVEQTLPHGALVRGTPKQLEKLATRGFRVKVLPDTNILRIGAYRIDTEGKAPATPSRLDVPRGEGERWPHHLLQLSAPPNEEWVRAIEQQGVDVVEPVGAYGLFVVATREQVKRVGELPFVEWTGPFKPAYRLSPSTEGLSGRVQLSIGVYPESAADEVLQAIRAVNGELVEQETQEATYRDAYAVLRVIVDAGKINDLARLPHVRWVEHQPPYGLDDERTSQILAENLDGTPPPNTAPVLGYQAALAALGLSGAGVTIGVVDSGVDTHNNASMHADLAGRMAFFADATGGALIVDTDGHGTHVAGCAVGNGATGDTDPQGFVLGLGVAPGAQFGSVNNIGTGGTLGNTGMVTAVVNGGGQIMNNSWSSSLAPGQGYTASSRTFDLCVRDPNSAAAGLEYLVMVSSAGNKGPGLNTISGPWEAKNPICVGNSLNFRPGEGDPADDIRGLRNSSGRGPAIDGRIFPTIVAPGTNVTSARSSVDSDPNTPGVQRPRPAYTDTGATTHDDYVSISGTSQAVPHVSGLCALLIEWWRNRTGGLNPSPALLKALLVNGAEDIVGGPNGTGGPITNIPSPDQGWGRVSLENIVLQSPASDRGPRIFLDQEVVFTASGEEHVIRVAPVDTARPMRVTLTWTDAAGAANAAPALVNDLDLEVTEIDTGNVFRGNVFNNGFSVTGGAFDTLNNVECVYIQNPVGQYEIAVIASNVAASANPGIATPWQDFALVVDNAELPVETPVSVMSVLDRSGSMVAAGYVDVTRTTSKQFIDLLGVDDRIGVVSFGNTADVEFPGAATLETVAGQLTREAAKTEVDGINFGGCTFMGAAIEQAAAMLAPEVGRPKAMVLLSDGYDNKGCDAGNPAKPSALQAAGALPDNIAVYTCAMGPASDQALLEQIATTTGGVYYYMPAIEDLFEISNYLRSQLSGDSLSANDSEMASASSVDAFIDATASEATITVAWADTRLKYVAGDPRKANEVSVRLRDPKGRRLHGHSSFIRRIVGNGYVIFRLADPLPGKWRVEVETAGDTHVRYTVGCFLRSPLRLVLDPRLKLVRGLPLRVSARVFDGKKPIDAFTANARIVAPSAGIPTLLKQHDKALQKVRIAPVPGGDRLPQDVGRLATLRTALIREGKPDLFAVSRDQLALKRTANALSGQFARTAEPGSYNVVVTVSGKSPDSDTRFVRKQLVSVLVS